jgi:hypothetical protein
MAINYKEGKRTNGMTEGKIKKRAKMKKFKEIKGTGRKAGKKEE